jgi:hypothetical protein
MKRKRPIGLIILVTLFTLGSFFVVVVFILNWADVFKDFSELEGEIITKRRSLHVDERIGLELALPEQFDALHRLHWEVDPAAVGEIDYDLVREEDREKTGKKTFTYPTWDRTAMFTGLKPGRCTVMVYGFFKKSELQFVAKLELAVTP